MSSELPLSLLEDLAPHRDAVRVLLVEDDPHEARVLTEMLRGRGDDLLVTTCTRLADAETPIAGGLADLVLLDLESPGGGLAGLRHLRALAPDVPVVVLSDREDERIGIEAVQAGAQDVLTCRGVEPGGLGRAIRYAVERQRAERRGARLALRDPLTRLPNRVLLADRLEQTMARGRRRRRPGSPMGDAAQEPLVLLMVVDIDDLAAVNHTHGHAEGDRRLVELADRLRGHLREGDTVARLGGDEFVVLVEDVTDEAAGLRLAERLAGLVTNAQGSALELSVSVGVAAADPGVEGGADLLLRADEAVRAAKRIGPGRCAMADPPAPAR